MAGHSHWAGIKHKKAKEDKKRGKIFSKCVKKIMVAARDGGGDPETNLALRYAIDEAKAANMPKENIERAIKKGTGDLEGVSYEEVVYEGFGPGGSGFILHLLTDNRNRTASEIRKIFEQRGGNMAANGAVSHMFERKGLLAVPTDAIDEDTLFMTVLEAGCEDVETGDDYYQITTDPSHFEDVKTAIKEDLELKPEVCEISMIPNMDLPLEPADQKKSGALYEDLEDHDDVQDVYVNFELPDDIEDE